MAMSGGVDSSTGGYLLKERGYEVTGAFMRLLGDYEPHPDRKACCSAQDIEDARQAATRLDFNFLVFNFQVAFQTEVIAPFAKAYAQGLTPNPCLECNRRLKFQRFLERAKILGHDYMATGHYARVEYDPQRKRYLLKKALDLTKDQSYALYTMTQEELSQTLFPLGEVTKPEIRRLAGKLNLAAATKPDSQDICFVPNGRYTDFLTDYLTTQGLKPQPGRLVDRQGNQLGEHKGIHHFTVGQRKGLNIQKPGPWYVLELNPLTHEVVVGPIEELGQKEALVTDLNYIAFETLTAPIKVMAKIRYRQTEIPALLSPHPKGAVLTFQKPPKGVSPGQAAVFYEGDTVLGGGSIAREKP
jgi:tRNA-specific 2-thiouridylase